MKKIISIFKFFILFLFIFILNSKNIEATEIQTSYTKIEAVTTYEYIVKENEKYGVLRKYPNHNIEVIVPIIFDNVEKIGTSLFIVTKENKQGLYNKKQIILNPNYDKVKYLGFDTFNFCSENKCGFYDNKLKKTSKMKYDEILAIDGDRLKVTINGKEKTISKKSFGAKFKDASKKTGIAILYICFFPFAIAGYYFDF